MLFEKWEKLPIFKKALEIQDLILHITETVEKSDINFNSEAEAEMIKRNIEYLKENALIIPAKIAGAADEDVLYDIKMENASIIRKAAREIITDLRGIQLFGFTDIDYLDLLRTEIEAFRLLFAKWVQSFDCWNYAIDRWGLFNPPGVNFDDVDPDELLP